MAWPGTTSALDRSSRRAGSCFNLGVAAESFSTDRVGYRTDKYFGLALFFPALWAAGENPTQSYCQSTVSFAPNAKSG